MQNAGIGHGSESRKSPRKQQNPRLPARREAAECRESGKAPRRGQHLGGARHDEQAARVRRGSGGYSGRCVGDVWEPRLGPGSPRLRDVEMPPYLQGNRHKGGKDISLTRGFAQTCLTKIVALGNVGSAVVWASGTCRRGHTCKGATEASTAVLASSVGARVRPRLHGGGRSALTARPATRHAPGRGTMSLLATMVVP